MASTRKIVFAQISKSNHNGKREIILQAYEIVNGKREPISSPERQITLDEKHKGKTIRPKFKARKKPFKIQEK